MTKATLVDNIDKLETVANLVDEVRSTLDTSHSNCGCCGLVNYETVDEFRMWQRLGAALTRINEVCAQLDHVELREWK